MARWIPAACAALALASTGALAQSIGTAPLAGQAGGASNSATASDSAKEGAPPQRLAPSRPSKPLTASTPGSGNGTEPDAVGAPAGVPDPMLAPTTSIGGRGSAGLGAMGGGIDVTAPPATSQMGAAAGNLMPDCPMGMVRHLGLCVTYDQARRAQMPKAQR